MNQPLTHIDNSNTSLTSLVSTASVTSWHGNRNIDITGIASDSRSVAPGNIFVAVPGTAVDGHSYIDMAIERGATAIVCEKLPDLLNPDVCYITVASSASALGYIASQWYGNPSRHLVLTGVTGTNGKTTTATLLYEMARLCGFRAGLLSTVCNYIDSTPVPATQTTPDPITINRLLREMVDAGCQYAFMEVSSHAAHQCRIDGLHFKCGVFTNLTRDHLDYHKTTQNYIAAKKRFFDLLPPDATALVNIDDANGKVMVQSSHANTRSYSLRSMSDYHGKIVESRLDGTLLEINGREVEVMFVGSFNAYNLLAVYGAADIIGLPKEDLLVNLSRLIPVAGRFQVFQSPRGYVAVVDYAHTPDALKNVLTTVRDVAGQSAHIITVVGAGGNRDKGKRPIMGSEASRHSNTLIVTSDNPRNENPDDIITEIMAGVPADKIADTLQISDRRSAIRTAMKMANPGDVVVIAGKGHETYQEINGIKHHFDDREVVNDVIAAEANNNNSHI